MYCPKCSQQQVSEQQRFCSRCGFPLSGVADLVAADGVLPAPEKKARRRSPRYEGVRQGVILLMLAVVLLPLVEVIGPPYHEALVFMFLLASFMRAGYALIFQEGAAKRSPDASESRSSQTATAELSGGEHGAALPPASGRPVADFNSRQGEMAGQARPSSVTDNTTKLLDDQPDV
jgi:hypothetical protein